MPMTRDFRFDLFLRNCRHHFGHFQPYRVLQPIPDSQLRLTFQSGLRVLDAANGRTMFGTFLTSSLDCETHRAFSDYLTFRDQELYLQRTGRKCFP